MTRGIRRWWHSQLRGIGKENRLLLRLCVIICDQRRNNSFFVLHVVILLVQSIWRTWRWIYRYREDCLIVRQNTRTPSNLSRECDRLTQNPTISPFYLFWFDFLYLRWLWVRYLYLLSRLRCWLLQWRLQPRFQQNPELLLICSKARAC